MTNQRCKIPTEYQWQICKNVRIFTNSQNKSQIIWQFQIENSYKEFFLYDKFGENIRISTNSQKNKS